MIFQPHPWRPFFNSLEIQQIQQIQKLFRQARSVTFNPVRHSRRSRRTSPNKVPAIPNSPADAIILLLDWPGGFAQFAFFTALWSVVFRATFWCSLPSFLREKSFVATRLDSKSF